MNSQGHTVNAKSLKLYPNHFSSAGMDFFALPDAVVEQGIYYSLYGVGGRDLEPIRAVARRWLDKSAGTCVMLRSLQNAAPSRHPL